MCGTKETGWQNARTPASIQTEIAAESGFKMRDVWHGDTDGPTYGYLEKYKDAMLSPEQSREETGRNSPSEKQEPRNSAG